MESEDRERLLKYLYDALSAAEEVVMNTLELSLRNYYYINIRWIAERGIEIISEALKRANKIQNELPISNVTKIYATRNKIAHEYDLVDPNLIYTIVIKYLPILIEELKVLIEQINKEK
jgi:uncharacterized protein with HEPN domain